MRHNVRRFLAGLLAVAAITSGLTAMTASPAGALCAQQAEEGTWVNRNPATRSITRAEIHMTQCGDTVLNGVPTVTTYSMRLFGACHPTDCDWGTVSATDRQTSSGDWWKVGTYHFGFKTSTAWARVSNVGGEERLRVWVWNNYHDSRTDRATNDWFVRA